MTEQDLLRAVRMICGCLADLSTDDQARALEQACVALGLRVFVAQSDPGPLALLSPSDPSPADRPPLDPDPVPTWLEMPAARAPLPMVHVEMRGDRPMVVNRSTAYRPRPAMLVTDAQARLSRPPQPLLAERSADPSSPLSSARPRGYICRIR